MDLSLALPYSQLNIRHPTNLEQLISRESFFKYACIRLAGQGEVIIMEHNGFTSASLVV